MVDIIEKVAFLNNTNDYLMVKGVAETFTYFGWTDKAIGTAQNLFGGGGSSVITMTVENTSQTTERLANFSSQNVAQLRVAITTKETSLWKGKTVNRKRYLNFPRGSNLLWVSYILAKQLDLTKIKSFKGIVSFKRVGGGRFPIAVIPDDVMTRSITGFKAASLALKTASRESTTESQPIQNIAATP